MMYVIVLMYVQFCIFVKWDSPGERWQLFGPELNQILEISFFTFLIYLEVS